MITPAYVSAMVVHEGVVTGSDTILPRDIARSLSLGIAAVVNKVVAPDIVIIAYRNGIYLIWIGYALYTHSLT